MSQTTVAGTLCQANQEPDMPRLIVTSLFLFIIGATVMAQAVQASNQPEIDRLLAQKDAPFGVVFEISEGNGDALKWAIPAVNKYVKQLREKFPDIGLAVVSHGVEEFGLMKNKQEKNAEVHKTVQSLVASDVPVHVCGTHASWKGVSENDFPDYIDVAPAGPTEIRNYEAMGYVRIEVERP
jgi:intracellular sulfur oxidation DsrE/DsrF family protein